MPCGPEAFSLVVLGLEGELESMKDANDKKLESLETKLVDLTREISSLKSEGNQDLKESLEVDLKNIYRYCCQIVIKKLPKRGSIVPKNPKSCQIVHCEDKLS